MIFKVLQLALVLSLSSVEVFSEDGRRHEQCSNTSTPECFRYPRKLKSKARISAYADVNTVLTSTSKTLINDQSDLNLGLGLSLNNDSSSYSSYVGEGLVSRDPFAPFRTQHLLFSPHLNEDINENNSESRPSIHSSSEVSQADQNLNDTMSIDPRIDHRGLTIRDTRSENSHQNPSNHRSRTPGRAGTPRGRLLAGGPRLAESRTIQLKTDLGIVTGTLEFSVQPTTPPSSGRRYYSFRGLPYAEPPVGELRWAPPQPLKGGWPGGTADGRRHKSFCPQYDHDQNKVVGSEDCLFLNVYTPYLPGENSRLLPVLVFIHGGAYTRGAASSHGPQRLMTEDVVVVTMNYRLGVLGFLSDGTEELAGNYGALDQVTALQWVRAHISSFGGDARQVTLGGFSAGAGFVHLHLLSPLSKGLFHRAIMMSGSGNCQWSVQPHPDAVAADLAQDLGCSAGAGLRDCLRDKPVQDLLKFQTNRQRYVYWPFLYRPVVDGGLRDAPFLPAPVSELLNRPPASSVAVLGGSTRHEGILFALTTILFSRNPGSASQVYDEATVYLLGSLWPNTTSTHDISRLLHSFYYSTAAKDNLDELLQQMSEAMTDQLITSCIWDALEHLSASTRAPVYTYLMTHHDPGSPSFAFPLYRLAQELGIKSSLLQAGVSHGDDVILLFSFPHNQVEPGPRDQQMSAILTNMWANFIITGSPQGGRLSSSLPPWSPLRPGEPLTFYRLSLTPGMVTQPFRYKERNLWQQTLPLVESMSDDLEETLNWQIATWVVSVVSLLLLLALLLLLLGLLLSRRKKQYPAGTATLRSRQPRSSTYGTPGERAE
ncbi:Carboxylesterase type B [Trinorchestia longiramus]|nr:Carboxylesterase type B [Trinorchestia longiramus]